MSLPLEDDSSGLPEFPELPEFGETGVKSAMLGPLVLLEIAGLWAVKGRAIVAALCAEGLCPTAEPPVPAAGDPAPLEGNAAEVSIEGAVGDL